MYDYFLDVLILSLPIVISFTVLFVLISIFSYFVIGKIFPKWKLLCGRYLSKKEVFLYYLISITVIVFIKGTSDTVTWRNTIHDTAQEVQRIQYMNSIRNESKPPIVDKTKQPDRNVETTKTELHENINEWKQQKQQKQDID